jgi:hypothetical protein
MFKFSDNRVIYEIMWKNMVRPDRPRMIPLIGRICFACQITKAKKHTFKICNTYRFSTIKMVMRRRLCYVIACLVKEISRTHRLSDRYGVCMCGGGGHSRAPHFNF